MKLYADLPSRRTTQFVGDLLLALWIVLWIWLATRVHEATEELAIPGRRIDASAGDLGAQLHDAAGSVGDLPIVGDDASKPLNGAGDAAEQLARAGRAQVEAVDTLAFWLAITTALVPILLVLAFYVPRRVRFVRRATAGQRLIDSAADLDLFALRALTHQPLHVLARISDDPAGRWRARDPEIVRRLALLDLADAGLAPPPADGRR
ncbi:hypothetical protein SAMN04487968_11114 [Nocardioides terrae]|uniref:Transmembrane protein n=1 Tax=Nocardioides terrae TaxID=574651 RepID=A0A1I1LU06_9ACTN|nr:hypothetical protein [Nocardioides terrae]SFC76475.1 hypothetical protein SAMN04487968_11114 [Nocardioides terrae]